MFEWSGQDAELISRATDETGYIQPTQHQLVEARGANTGYHLNPITGIRFKADGSVVYRQETWA